MGVPLDYRADARKPTKGDWRGTFTWNNRNLYVSVAGTYLAPAPGLEATLAQVIDRFDDVVRAIEAFATALAPDARVRFRRREAECFAAGICGFEPGAFYVDGVEVSKPERPDEAMVSFVTGSPDGHVSFQAVLEGGRPVEILAEV